MSQWMYSKSALWRWEKALSLDCLLSSPASETEPGLFFCGAIPPFLRDEKKIKRKFIGKFLPDLADHSKSCR